MIRLAIRAPVASAERVLAAVLELAPGGVEQVDGEGFVEYAIYGAAGELPALPRGEAELAGVRVAVSGEDVGEDWEKRWKRFHTGVVVGERLALRPPWEDRVERAGVHDLVIDPGQPFGTGSHPTTRLCLELLLELAAGGSPVDPPAWGPLVDPPVRGPLADPPARRSLADLGCGSGVLAIAAAKLGFGDCAALDSERAAIEATAAAALANGVEIRRIERFDLRQQPAPWAEVWIANLTRPLLLAVAALMREPPADLIVSGLLEQEADEVADAFAPLVERRRRSLDGWSALLLGAQRRGESESAPATSWNQARGSSPSARPMRSRQ